MKKEGKYYFPSLKERYMIELLNLISQKDTSIKFNFTNVTNLAELKNTLSSAHNTYTLDESATFNYDTGICIRKGTASSNDTSISSWITSSPLLVLKDCAIPRKIYLKAHTTQVNKSRCFASITIKIGSNYFNLLYYRDSGYQIQTSSTTVDGVMFDGFPNNSNCVISVSKNRLNISETFYINSTSAPNFMSFVGNNSNCDIIYHQMLIYKGGGDNYQTYPFYIEQLDIDF